MKTNNTKKSFTLVEILVVVAIIGLLATIIMVNLSGVGEKGNNARRMQDLRSLHTALTSYNFNQMPRQFPLHTVDTATTPNRLTEGVLNPTYIQKIPTDPDPVGSGATGGYIYVGWTTAAAECTATLRCKLFSLCVTLEPASPTKSFYCNKGGCKELSSACTATPSPEL